jgi:hypothetical protein
MTKREKSLERPAVLLAEIHGKTLEGARHSEDYLTSAVFGHLRYVPPGPFWNDLLNRARGLPGPTGKETSLGRLLAAAGHSLSAFTGLKIEFWRLHEKHGEPDLFLKFTADGRPELVVLIEVKLWSEKSGSGEFVQLVCYLRIPEVQYLIYLTPRESLSEVEDSATWLNDSERDRLFRLQWQDVLAAADAMWSGSHEPTCTILADVARFLRELGLEYFNGMSRLEELPMLDEDGFGAFYTSKLSGFHGTTREPGLDFFEVFKGAWA